MRAAGPRPLAMGSGKHKRHLCGVLASNAQPESNHEETTSKAQVLGHQQGNQLNAGMVAVTLGQRSKGGASSRLMETENM